MWRVRFISVLLLGYSVTLGKSAQLFGFCSLSEVKITHQIKLLPQERPFSVSASECIGAEAFPLITVPKLMLPFDNYPSREIISLKGTYFSLLPTVFRERWMLPPVFLRTIFENQKLEICSYNNWALFLQELARPGCALAGCWCCSLMDGGTQPSVLVLRMPSKACANSLLMHSLLWLTVTFNAQIIITKVGYLLAWFSTLLLEEFNSVH